MSFDIASIRDSMAHIEMRGSIKILRGQRQFSAKRRAQAARKELRRITDNRPAWLRSINRMEGRFNAVASRSWPINSYLRALTRARKA